MAIMFDWEIIKAVEEGEIDITPWDENNVGPASLDLVLGDKFLIPSLQDGEDTIRMDSPLIYTEVISRWFILEPRGFILAQTIEYIKLPANITGQVCGRSSIGRLGLFIENAGFFDPGFEGVPTLELFNAGRHPIQIDSKRRICQIIFSREERESRNPYRGKYKGQRCTTGSKISEDLDYKERNRE